MVRKVKYPGNNRVSIRREKTLQDKFGRKAMRLKQGGSGWATGTDRRSNDRVSILCTGTVQWAGLVTDCYRHCNRLLQCPAPDPPMHLFTPCSHGLCKEESQSESGEWLGGTTRTMQLFLWPGGALLFVLLLLLLLLLESGRCISGRFWVFGCWWRLNYLHGLTNIFHKNKPISDTNTYTDKQTLSRQTRAGNTGHVARSVSACVPLRLSPYSTTRPVNIRLVESTRRSLLFTFFRRVPWVHMRLGHPALTLVPASSAGIFLLSYGEVIRHPELTRCLRGCNRVEKGWVLTEWHGALTTG